MNAVDARFEQILSDMLQIYRAKAADYDGESIRFSNLRECEKIGVPAWKGAIIRMTDKYSRLLALLANDGVGQVPDESFTDTLTDLANYAIICRILYEESLSEAENVDPFQYAADLAEKVKTSFQRKATDAR